MTVKGECRITTATREDLLRAGNCARFTPFIAWKLVRRQQVVRDAPMLSASSRWKPSRSATTNAQAIIIGARFATVVFVNRT